MPIWCRRARFSNSRAARERKTEDPVARSVARKMSIRREDHEKAYFPSSHVDRRFREAQIPYDSLPPACPNCYLFDDDCQHRQGRSFHILKPTFPASCPLIHRRATRPEKGLLVLLGWRKDEIVSSHSCAFVPESGAFATSTLHFRIGARQSHLSASKPVAE